MSTLSISSPRFATTRDAGVEVDVDARFDSLVRGSSVAPHGDHDGVDFETVFDLDYGEARLASVVPIREAAPTQRVRRVRQVRHARRASTRTAPTGRVRLTRRGRGVLMLGFVAIALALMIPMSGWATATLTGGSPEPVRIVEVQPGDTLYGIAGDLAKPGQIRTMVHRIQELNSLPGGQITVGQKLAVPKH